MEKSIIDKLIASLDFIRVRVPENTHLFMGAASEQSCQIFLSGFETSCQAIGVTISIRHRELVAAQRGWESPFVNQAEQMRRTGLSEAQIISELLSIEMEALRSLEL